jgi:predicted dinucleotide-binding enzyme
MSSISIIGPGNMASAIGARAVKGGNAVTRFTSQSRTRPVR